MYVVLTHTDIHKQVVACGDHEPLLLFFSFFLFFFFSPKFLERGSAG